jgi:3-oxoisoapionate decarboxylase
MKLGLSSYTFGWAVGVAGHPPARPLTEQDLLDRCAAHQLSVLQLGDNLPAHDFSTRRLAELAIRKNQQRVQLELGLRRLSVERIARYAELARSLDCSLIRVVIDDDDFHPTPAEVRGLLAEVVPLLEGLTLAIENHDRFRAETLRSIIESVGSPRLGVCLDTANSIGAGQGTHHVAEVLAPLTVNLHIKDFAIHRLPHKMGFVVQGSPAGLGLLDIPRVLDVLRPYNRCHTAILELWTPPEPALEATVAKEADWAARSLRFLNPLFTKGQVL